MPGILGICDMHLGTVMRGASSYVTYVWFSVVLDMCLASVGENRRHMFSEYVGKVCRYNMFEYNMYVGIICTTQKICSLYIDAISGSLSNSEKRFSRLFWGEAGGRGQTGRFAMTPRKIVNN